MVDAKIGTVSVFAKKVDFCYDFTVPGFEKIAGKSNVIINGNPTLEKIQEEVSGLVVRKVEEFLQSKDVLQSTKLPDMNSLSANIEIVEISNFQIDMQIKPKR